MKYRNSFNTEIISSPTTDLLGGIRAIRRSVGDGLNDDEFTRLLQQSTLPIEAGFRFLSYCDKFVTLGVPRQELANWYPEKGWITPEKERIARAIAEKYELSLSEPPDLNFNYVYPRSDSPELHHHLELSTRRETIIVAHPQYLKVCLLGATPVALNTRTANGPPSPGPELLQDLAALYQT